MEEKSSHLIKTLLDQIADLHASMCERYENIETSIATVLATQTDHQEDMEDRFRSLEILLEDLQLSTDTVTHFVTLKRK